MKLNLNSLYTDIKRKKRTYDIYTIFYGNKELQVLFDIGTLPFRLYIMRKGSREHICLSVMKGFQIQTYLSEDDFRQLRSMLDLSDKEKGFSTKTFFAYLNQQIPDRCQNEKISRKMLAHITGCEDPDKIYVKGRINWEEQPTKRRVSHLNREKTRILYPDLYREICDQNISIIYSDLPEPKFNSKS